MNGIKIWIRDHQVVSFFMLAYLITWPGIFLALYIFPGNEVVELLSSWVVFGPALAAMVVSGIANLQPRLDRNKGRWITFALIWILAAVVQLLYFKFIHRVDLNLPIVVVCCVFALLPAWMVSNAFSRNPGIRNVFSTLIKPRGSRIWYLVIFLVFPGIPLLSLGITRLYGGEAIFTLAEEGFSIVVLYMILEFSRGFLMTGGINEESGWRGFALPRLQSRYPVIVAALIVWFFWAAWHLPYDFALVDDLGWILENRLVWNLLISIIMTWLYNRTNGSLLAPALFHPAMNTFGNLFSSNPVGRGLIIAVALFAFVSDKMWKKLPLEHPASHSDQLVEVR